MLDDVERALFRRLAVFAGGFTPEAAAAVCDTDESGVLEGIGSLVDKSLVRTRGMWPASRATGCSETIREFGEELLTASGREAAVRRRHADWCLSFAERAGPRAKQADAARWLAALEQEHANLRAALTWLAGQGDGNRLVRLSGALWPFWRERTYFGEGLRWLEIALDHGTEAPAADRLRALSGAGVLAWYQTEITRSIHWHEQALALAREVGDRRAEAFALCDLAGPFTELGDHDRAIAVAEAALAIARAAGEPEPTVLALYNLSHLAWLKDEAEVARDRLAESLALAREHEVNWLFPRS